MGYLSLFSGLRSQSGEELSVTPHHTSRRKRHTVRRGGALTMEGRESMPDETAHGWSAPVDHINHLRRPPASVGLSGAVGGRCLGVRC